MVHLSKTVYGIFDFRFRLTLYFCSTKSSNYLTLKNHNPFENKNNKEATHGFAPTPMIFKLQQEV